MTLLLRTNLDSAGGWPGDASFAMAEQQSDALDNRLSQVVQSRRLERSTVDARKPRKPAVPVTVQSMLAACDARS
ncbi:MAG: hypothetical protein ACLPUT_00205 [Solirubrobacteraceae bacterium]|jgi:hypothetical protein